MAAYASEFFPPDLSAPHLRAIGRGLLETLAMSAIGTLLAALLGLLFALPAAGRFGVPAQSLARLLLNALRAVPELVWGALMVLAAGLRAERRDPRPGAAHRRRARPAVRRSPGEHPGAARRGPCAWPAADASRHSPMAPCRGLAATGGLYPVPLGEQYPHGQRARLRRCRRARADALFQPEPVPAGPGRHGDPGHAGPGARGRQPERLGAAALGQPMGKRAAAPVRGNLRSPPKIGHHRCSEPSGRHPASRCPGRGRNHAQTTAIRITAGPAGPRRLQPAPTAGRRADREQRLGTQWGEGVASPVTSWPCDVYRSNRSIAARCSTARAASMDVPSGTALAKGRVGFAVLDEDGGKFDLVQHRSTLQLQGREGQRYRLWLNNLGSATYEVVATVDGLDVLNGQPGSLKNRGYVLEPGESLVIEGFRKNEREVAAFQLRQPRRCLRQQQRGRRQPQPRRDRRGPVRAGRSGQRSRGAGRRTAGISRRRPERRRLRAATTLSRLEASSRKLRGGVPS